ISKLIDEINEDEDLASSFFFSFAKAKVDYVSLKKFVQVERTDDPGNPITYNRFRVLSANRNNIYNEILNKWDTNLKVLGGSNILKTEDGKTVIDTDKASLYYNEYNSYVNNLDKEFTFRDA